MTRQDILPSMPPRYKVRRLRLHSQHQVIVVMRADCDVCRSEGLAIRSQVLVTHGERHIHAILFQVEGEAMLALDEIGLSEAAWWTCNGFAPVTYLIMPPWLQTRAG